MKPPEGPYRDGTIPANLMSTRIHARPFEIAGNHMPLLLMFLSMRRVARPSPLPAVIIVTLVAMVGTASVVAASDHEVEQPAQPQPARSPDFLFGWPRTYVGVAGGWLAASARDGIFDLTRELLTVDHRDFDSGVVRFQAGRALSPRFDLSGEVGFSKATVLSEYRDFLEGDLPISQATEFTQAPVSANLRIWLVPRGRAVGRFAWVPSRLAPYASGGVGAYYYRFKQIGDFVDFVDFSIFTDHLQSSGWAASAHMAGGLSVHMVRQLFLTVEARYGWAGTPLSEDFIGFEDIDLNGFQVTGGLEFAF